MNNYPEWWDDTITLFNKYTDPTTKKVKWFPHVITDTFYKIVQEKLTVNTITVESDSTICRIRVSDDFVNPIDWNELPDNNIVGSTVDPTITDTKETKFTLRMGDIIVAGEVDFEVDEYDKGKRSSDLLAKYREWPGCFTVETVAINVGGGRGNEHYSARGK